jgi:hypothetical protein
MTADEPSREDIMRALNAEPVTGRTLHHDPDQMCQYVITQSPADHPNKFVVRLLFVTKTGVVATSEHAVCDTLDEVRSYVPLQASVCMNRDPSDDPVIVEVWF